MQKWQRAAFVLMSGFIFFVPAAHACETSAHSHSPPIQTDVLLQSSKSWDGTPYKAYPGAQPELTILKIKVAPHTQLKWHTHPMPNAGYILSGKLKVETKSGQKEQWLSQGDVIAEMVGSLHRGSTGSEPVELIVFYAGTEGMPLSVAE